MRTGGCEDGLVPLGNEIVHLQVLSNAAIGSNFHTGALDVVDVSLEYFSGQSEFRYAHGQHAPGDRVLFEHGDLAAHLSQIERAGQSGRPGAYNGHLLLSALSGGFRLEHKPALQPVIGDEPLQISYPDRLSCFACSALLLTRMVAYPGQDRGKRIVLLYDLKSFVIPSPGDQRDIDRSFGIYGTGVLARGRGDLFAHGRLTFLLLHVIVVLSPEIAQRCQHGVRSGLPQAAQGGIPHHLGQLFQGRQIFLRRFPLCYVRRNLQHLLGALPAGETLAAGLILQKAQKVLGHVHHAGALIHDDHAP